MTSRSEGEGGSHHCDDVWRRGGVKGTVTSHTSHLRQGLARESEIRAPEGTAIESYAGISIRTLWAWYSHHSELCWQPRMIPTPSPIPRCSGWTLGRPWLLSLLYKQIELQRPAWSPGLPGLAAAAAVQPVIERQPRPSYQVPMDCAQWTATSRRIA